MWIVIDTYSDETENTPRVYATNNKDAAINYVKETFKAIVSDDDFMDDDVIYKWELLANGGLVLKETYSNGVVEYHKAYYSDLLQVGDVVLTLASDLDPPIIGLGKTFIKNYLHSIGQDFEVDLSTINEYTEVYDFDHHYVWVKQTEIQDLGDRKYYDWEEVYSE